MAWELPLEGHVYEKIYCRNCNLLYAAFYVCMGMVVLILFATLILSILLGSISKNRIKYVYPVVAVAAFLPSVFLHYNGTAFVQAVWYFVIAAVGMLLGTIIFKVLHRM